MPRTASSPSLTLDLCLKDPTKAHHLKFHAPHPSKRYLVPPPPDTQISKAPALSITNTYKHDIFCFKRPHTSSPKAAPPAKMTSPIIHFHATFSKHHKLEFPQAQASKSCFSDWSPFDFTDTISIREIVLTSPPLQ